MVQELQEANDTLRSESATSDETTPEQPHAPPINYQIKMVETKVRILSYVLYGFSELQKNAMQNFIFKFPTLWEFNLSYFLYKNW